MADTVEWPPVPTGAFKSFGPHGPKYQVGRLLRPLAGGDWMVEVVLIESGERTEYSLAHLMDDPDAL